MSGQNSDPRHSPRTVAYISSSRIPSRAANAIHVLNMAAGFGEQGLNVTLFARGDPRPVAPLLADFGIETQFTLDLTPFRRLPLLDRFGFIRHLRNHLASGAFDFAYGRSCYSLLWGVPSSVPLAYDIHSFSTHPVQRQLEALLFRRSNFLFATAINRALANAYVEAYPQLDGNIVVAPCGAAIPTRVEPQDRFADRPMQVYYVGHLYEGRGISLIFKIAEIETGMRFHVVGGEDCDVALWRTNAPSNVKFHGYVKPAVLSQYFADADVCISPHQRTVAGSGGGNIAAWTSPMKVFEYMSHGKPIVAADLPAIGEILRDEQNALLCPPDDAQAWAAALRRLAANHELRQRLGKNAEVEFRENYTWEARTRKILEAATRRMSSETFKRCVVGRSAARPPRTRSPFFLG